VAGVDLFIEPEAEPEGDDGVVVVLPLVLPLPDGRSIPVVLVPRSHAAIRLAPSARDTATARV
jgi:hypothetical protein